MAGDYITLIDVNILYILLPDCESKVICDWLKHIF